MIRPTAIFILISVRQWIALPYCPVRKTEFGPVMALQVNVAVL